MLQLDNVVTTDNYNDCSIASESGSHVVYLIANNSARMQVRGLFDTSLGNTPDWTPPEGMLVAPTTAVIDKCSGIRFKSVLPGRSAQIIAQLMEPKDVLPQSGTPFTQQLTASGEVPPVGIAAMELIQAITLSTASPSIDFLAIPQTFRHLMVTGNLHGDAAATLVEVDCQANGDGSGLYYWSEIEQGPTLAIGAANVDTKWRVGVMSGASIADTSIFSTFEFWLPNYTDSGKKAHFHSRCGAWDSARMNQDINTGLYNFLGAPITRLRFFAATGNLIVGSSLALYGVH